MSNHSSPRAAVLAAVLLCGCGLPRVVTRPYSAALTDTRDTTLGRAIAPAVAAHPSESGFLLFNTGEGAIQARVSLADTAQSTIDAQYFEWAGDELGRVLLDRILAAADRGVRVRLLIDDYNTAGLDIGLATLDAHPNVEVRVFNPYVRGRSRLLQVLGRFTELNHRMHNKMWVADGQVAVIGGRNLTNDYFGMGKKLSFRDFDLLAIGEVVAKVEGAFDTYWNSRWAYPISSLHRPATPEDLRKRRERFAAKVAADRASFPYALPSSTADALRWLAQFEGQAIWAPAEVVYDDPALMSRPLQGEMTRVGKRLSALAEQARSEIVIENAYIIPKPDSPIIHALRGRGVQLKMLTNSLASTDVVAVNAAYAKRRPELLLQGVALYEMKPWAESRRRYLARPEASKAHLALHGKAAVLDREIVFIGSFNLDPRSMYIDTETVFVVHSPALAAQILDAFAVDFEPANAWHMGRVTGKKSVAWVTEQPSGTEVEPHDPAGFWRRLYRALAGILPIANLL